MSHGAHKEIPVVTESERIVAERDEEENRDRGNIKRGEWATRVLPSSREEEAGFKRGDGERRMKGLEGEEAEYLQVVLYAAR